MAAAPAPPPTPPPPPPPPARRRQKEVGGGPRRPRAPPPGARRGAGWVPSRPTRDVRLRDGTRGVHDQAREDRQAERADSHDEAAPARRAVAAPIEERDQ